jgi:threonine/homoserine/homoserine lactone efflux protein
MESVVMTMDLYLAYVAACILIVIVPGPTVTVIIANSLSYGTRAGLLNVAGTQLGLAVMIGILLVGLTSIIETMGWWFDWLRLAGAAYLVWLGYKLIRSGGGLDAMEARKPPRGGFFMQGMLVIFSNPKALLFFGAFIPQFVNPQGDYVLQIVLLGATFMVVATVLDGTYAVLSGGAGAFLTRQRVKLVSRVSGLFLIGGGIWLAMTRAR